MPSVRQLMAKPNLRGSLSLAFEVERIASKQLRIMSAAWFSSRVDNQRCVTGSLRRSAFRRELDDVVMRRARFRGYLNAVAT